MIECYKWPVSFCSWSVSDDLHAMAEVKDKLGIGGFHLHLGPALDGDDGFLDAVSKQGWVVTCAMVSFAQEDYSSLGSIRATGGIVPQDCWEINRGRVLRAIELTAELSLKYLSFHFGFIDHDNRDYAKSFAEKTKLLADAAQKSNVMLLMETGQESAAQLRRFLEELDHPALGVNFDPANMILYDKGDPVEAVEILSRWIKHVHIKDAVKSDTPGQWGREVPWGDGQVGCDEFLRALKEAGFSGALAIEREAGEKRFADIALAAGRLSSFIG